MNRSPLDGLRPSRPAPELRERVLRAAIEADAPTHWVDRLWTNGRLRFAAAIAIALLLLAHAAIGGSPVPARVELPAAVVVEGIAIPSAVPAPEPAITASAARELGLEVAR
jgi:hypothetical protein